MAHIARAAEFARGSKARALIEPGGLLAVVRQKHLLIDALIPFEHGAEQRAADAAALNVRRYEDILKCR